MQRLRVPPAPRGGGKRGNHTWRVECTAHRLAPSAWRAGPQTAMPASKQCFRWLVSRRSVPRCLFHRSLTSRLPFRGGFVPRSSAARPGRYDRYAPRFDLADRSTDGHVVASLLLSSFRLQASARAAEITRSKSSSSLARYAHRPLSATDFVAHFASAFAKMAATYSGLSPMSFTMLEENPRPFQSPGDSVVHPVALVACAAHPARPRVLMIEVENVPLPLWVPARFVLHLTTAFPFSTRGQRACRAMPSSSLLRITQAPQV